MKSQDKPDFTKILDRAELGDANAQLFMQSFKNKGYFLKSELLLLGVDNFFKKSTFKP